VDFVSDPANIPRDQLKPYPAVYRRLPLPGVVWLEHENYWFTFAVSERQQGRGETSKRPAPVTVRPASLMIFTQRRLPRASGEPLEIPHLDAFTRHSSPGDRGCDPGGTFQFGKLHLFPRIGWREDVADITFAFVEAGDQP
jgi:hypothetical protein